LKIPPPWNLAVLPLTDELVSLAEPRFKSPPPSYVVVLRVTDELVSVSVAETSLRIPPP
jgi:hypothetical protein